MNAPEYNWSCHRCSARNDAGVCVCAVCGFPAIATGLQINEATRAVGALQAESQAQKVSSQSALGVSWLYPKAIVALFIVLVSPYWIIKLLLDAHFQAAACLMASAIIAVPLVWFSWREKSKPVLYAATILLIFGAWAAKELSMPLR